MNQVLFQPDKILPVIYNQETSAYYTQIKIINNSNNNIYFYAATTFGPYADYRKKTQFNNNNPSLIIPPNQSYDIIFKIKSTNQISAQKQRIIISYGSYQILSYLIPQDVGNTQIFNLKFSQDFIQDELINSFLKAEAQSLCQQAFILYKKKDFKKAMNQYQQAFQLYRPYVNSLIGMVKAQFQLQMYIQGLKNIQAGILIDYNQQFDILKAQIIMIMLQKGRLPLKDSLKQCKHIIKKIQNLNQQENKNSINNSNQKQRINTIAKRLNQFQNVSKQKLLDEYIKRLKNKVIQNFEKQESMMQIQQKQNSLSQEMILKQLSKNNIKLKQAFKSKKQLNQFLNDLLKEDYFTNTVQTPEEVLDPITYQIMKDPYIVPYGNSYDHNYLISNFKIHGNKDPISRGQLRPEWIRPNNALKIYIKQHPDYGKWVMYQINNSTFHK